MVAKAGSSLSKSSLLFFEDPKLFTPIFIVVLRPPSFMSRKRNVENLSGSNSPPKKRSHLATTDMENGKVFLVLSTNGKASCKLWDRKQAEHYLNSDFARVVAFHDVEDADQYAKQAREAATQPQNALGESAQADIARTESESLPGNDVNTENAINTRNVNATVSATECVNSEGRDGIDRQEVPIANLDLLHINRIGGTELPKAPDTEASGHVKVFASSTTAKARGQIARMSYGIYFGEDSPHNSSGTVVGNISTQRADLKAAVEAVKGTVYHNLVTADGHVELCVSSTYVQKGIDNWMAKWKKAGWKNANRGQLKNGDLWKELDGLLEEIGRDKITVRMSTARESMELFRAGRLAESAMRR